MKVLVVLGICLLVAFSEADKDDKEGAKCVSLKERVENRTQEIVKEIEKTSNFEITPELQLQIKINAFSKAALECIPNNRIYGNIHVVLDELHNVIADFPTPKNVLKKIKEAQNFMEEHFDNLQALPYIAGFNMSSRLHSQIDKFLDENAEKAAIIFENNLKKSKDYGKVFDATGIPEVIDKLVEKMDECLLISPTAFNSSLTCHREVRSVGLELNLRKGGLRPFGEITTLPPDQSIDLLIGNFTAAVKELEWLFTNEKNKQKFLSEYKGFMP